MFCEYGRIKLEIYNIKTSEKFPNTWKLNTILNKL